MDQWNYEVLGLKLGYRWLIEGIKVNNKVNVFMKHKMSYKKDQTVHPV